MRSLRPSFLFIRARGFRLARVCGFAAALVAVGVSTHADERHRFSGLPEVESVELALSRNLNAAMIDAVRNTVESDGRSLTSSSTVIEDLTQRIKAPTVELPVDLSAS